MSREQDIRNAIWNIRRQYPESPSTFGPCVNDCGSGTPARGCGPCINCCVEELAKLTSEEDAKEFHKLTHETARLIRQLLGISE